MGASDYAQLSRAYVNSCAYYSQIAMETGNNPENMKKVDMEFCEVLRKAHSQWRIDILTSSEKGASSKLRFLEYAEKTGCYVPYPPGGIDVATWNLYAEELKLNAETKEEYDVRIEETMAKLSPEAREAWENKDG